MVFEVGKADRQHGPKLKRAVLTSPATGRMTPDSQSGTCGVSTENPTAIALVTAAGLVWLSCRTAWPLVSC